MKGNRAAPANSDFLTLKAPCMSQQITKCPHQAVFIGDSRGLAGRTGTHHGPINVIKEVAATTAAAPGNLVAGFEA